MTRKTISNLLVIFLLFAPLGAAAEVVIFDDFNDETVGQPPVAPDVGSYGTPSGTQTVIDAGSGDLRLRLTDDALDASAMLNYTPIANPANVHFEFVMRIESGWSVLNSDNAFTQSMLWQPSGSSLMLLWAASGKVYVQVSAGGSSTTTLVAAFSWAPDTDYPVAIDVDAASDTYTLSFLGTPVIVDRSLGADFTTLQSVSFASNFPTVASFQIDNVQVPEPEVGALSLAAVLTLAALARARRFVNS